jgi:uncharacterized repeat protein (TIGR03847 family)
MSDSYDFRAVTHFTSGAIGEPGQRVFYLQVGDERGHVSVRLEKQHVQALAHYFRSVLDDLPIPPGPDPEPVGLREPAVAEWVVGQIAVGLADAEGEIVVVVDELMPDDEGDDDESEELDLLSSETDGARIRAHVTPAQAAGFVATADDLMSKGRPPCRLCGQPLDPAGHACPRLN